MPLLYYVMLNLCTMTRLGPLSPLFPLINTYVVIVRQINEIFKVLVDIREHDARHG